MRRTLLTIAFVVALLFQSPANAQYQSCNDHASSLSHLLLKYQEQVVAQGLSAGGNLIQLVVSDKGETWTIIVVTPSGLACIVGGGENWETVDVEPLTPPGEDS